MASLPRDGGTPYPQDDACKIIKYFDGDYGMSRFAERVISQGKFKVNYVWVGDENE